VSAFEPLRLGLAALAVLLPSIACADAFEDAVMAELNHVRTDPASASRELDRYAMDAGIPGLSRASRGAIRDAYAVDEAVDFLRAQPPLPALKDDRRMAAAADDHVRSQGASGAVGHGAPGSLSERLHGHGVFAGMSGEAIAYGQETPRDVVRQLVVDYGVPDRGHRSLIFSRGYSVAGVACGPHPAYGRMCVIDFAGAFPR
jgi:hypothetical protein